MPDTRRSPDPRAALSWLLAPATDIPPRIHERGLAFLRILVGLMWLYNVSWKRAPDFGQEADNGLYHFTSLAVEHPVLPPYSWVVENLVLPNFELFGWGVLVAETALAVMLLSGSWVRIAAAVGIAQSVAIGLSVAYAPDEWPWAYWLMIGAHVVLFLSASGRSLGVDGVRAGVGSGARLAQTWGIVGVVAAVYSGIRSFDDPLAARGPGLASSDPSMSLGVYNLLGAAVLLAVAGLLLFLSARPQRTASLVAAGLGVVAALSLHAQLGFSDPLLGGNPTSAAMYLTLAVVAWAVGSRPDRVEPVHERTPA